MDVLIIMLVISIPAFWFWRWLIGKWVKASTHKNVYAGIATIFATPVLYVALLGAFFAMMLYYPKRDFDRARWQADMEKRYEMSADIIASGMLVGKSKSEVRELLSIKGKEDWEAHNTEESDHWEYYLGYRPTIGGIDPDVLDIYFKDGKVVKVDQHET